MYMCKVISIIYTVPFFISYNTSDLRAVYAENSLINWKYRKHENDENNKVWKYEKIVKNCFYHRQLPPPLTDDPQSSAYNCDQPDE
jgi:hypothetical protein